MHPGVPMTYGRAVTTAPPVAQAPRWAVPPRLDIALAGAFLLIVVAEALFSSDVTDPVPFLAVAGLSAVLLAWRRRFPLGVAVLVPASIWP